MIHFRQRPFRTPHSALRALAALALALLLASPADAKEPKVLFIGIDGCRFDAVQAARAPQLAALVAEGTLANDCQILSERFQGSDTCSGPGWSSILTGVWADKHGIVDNKFTAPNYREFPHFFARLKEVRPTAFTVSLVTWIPIQRNIVSAADIAEALLPPDEDWVQGDANVAQRAKQVLAQQNPTVLFAYFGQVDEIGHKHGFHPTSKEYIAAIERVDVHVGEVAAAMRQRPTYGDEDWLVIVTSDHGGQGTGHGGGHQVPEIRNSFLIVSGAAATRGKFEQQTYLVDAPVTALAHLGISPKADWKLDGKAVGLKDANVAGRAARPAGQTADTHGP